MHGAVDLRLTGAEYARNPSDEIASRPDTPHSLGGTHPMRELLASRRPSPAMAVAFIALLAALSGTAIALPGTSTVDSGDIVNGTIRGKDIHKNAVTGKKVKNGSLKSADVRDNSLTGTDINEGTLGTVPSANSANTANSANIASTVPDGSIGASKLGSITVRFAMGPDAADNQQSRANAFCPAGQRALGGGARNEFNSNEPLLLASRPVISADNVEAPEDGGTFTGWRATIFNPPGGSVGPFQAEVWVICLG
jgi:hypothetical protein